MIRTPNMDDVIAEAEFASRKFSFSPTSLGNLLNDPKSFYLSYVLRKKKWNQQKHLVEGSLIHFFILEHKSSFSNRFVISPEGLPSDNTVKVLDKIYDIYCDREQPELQLEDFGSDILDVLKEMDLHQSLTDDSKRIAKIVDSRGVAYFEFLRNRSGKTVVDAQLVDSAKRRADIILSNPELRILLGLDIKPNGIDYGVYNELRVEYQSENLPFDLQGVLDNVVADRRKKTITINDFKTTSGTLVDFKDTFEKYNYWLQPTIYKILLKDYFKNIYDKSWTINFNFVVFDRNDNLYVFPCSQESMDLWDKRLAESMEIAIYHIKNQSYNLPYAFATGSVVL